MVTKLLGATRSAETQLTGAMLTIVGNDIRARAAEMGWTGLDSGSYNVYDPIALWYNQLASPEYIVWKTSVSWEDLMRTSMDWTRVDNLAVGKARIWEWLGRLGAFDPSEPNIRAGIDQAWVGTAADLAVRAAIYTQCKRACKNIEKVFAVGNGTTASPATMGYEGVLYSQQVERSMQLTRV